MIESFNADKIVGVVLTPQDKLNMIYNQLRFMGEVQCHLNDDSIDLRGHTIEVFDGYVWMDNLYKIKFSTNYFVDMVGDIWRLCK